jgi:ParB/RepB/Spo0J family partition protein
MMAEPPRLTADDTANGETTHPTGRIDPALAAVEPSRPPVGDTRDGDATRLTGEPDPALANVEPSRPPVGDTRDGDATGPTGEADPALADVERSLLPRAARKFDVQHIPIDDIFVMGPRRALIEENVNNLVQSIERSGLSDPITVRIQENVPHPDTAEVLASAYGLVTGLHRLEACRRLGWRHIPAFVRDCSRLEAEVWEIEENLIRAELTPDEKAEHTIRLAALTKQMEESLEDSDFSKKDKPTTGRGIQLGSRGNDNPCLDMFASVIPKARNSAVLCGFRVPHVHPCYPPEYKSWLAVVKPSGEASQSLLLPPGAASPDLLDRLCTGLSARQWAVAPQTGRRYPIDAQRPW